MSCMQQVALPKCLHKSDFFKTNTDGTKNLVHALITLKMPIKRFVYLSSLNIFGAIRENSLLIWKLKKAIFHVQIQPTGK